MHILYLKCKLITLFLKERFQVYKSMSSIIRDTIFSVVFVFSITGSNKKIVIYQY